MNKQTIIALTGFGLIMLACASLHEQGPLHHVFFPEKASGCVQVVTSPATTQYSVAMPTAERLPDGLEVRLNALRKEIYDAESEVHHVDFGYVRRVDDVLRKDVNYIDDYTIKLTNDLAAVERRLSRIELRLFGMDCSKEPCRTWNAILGEDKKK